MYVVALTVRRFISMRPIAAHFVILPTLCTHHSVYCYYLCTAAASLFLHPLEQNQNKPKGGRHGWNFAHQVRTSANPASRVLGEINFAKNFKNFAEFHQHEIIFQDYAYEKVKHFHV